MTNPSENNKNQRKSVSRQTSVSNGDVNGHDMSHSHVPKTPNGDANHGNDFEIMSCPYARQTSINGIKSNGIHNGNKADISTIDENSDKIQAKKTLNYIDYLHLQSVLNSVHCLSHCDPFDVTSPPVHDEHFFIIIHQVFELWFKAFLFEIDSIRGIFQDPNQVALQLFYINLRLYRSVGIWNMLIDMLQRLETMTPVEFLAFRDYVTPASGFQSLQFRNIEIKLGLKDKSREAYKMNYFTNTMFKGEQADELNQSIQEDSLLTLVERWLEHIYDSIKDFDFLQEFTLAVEQYIDHTYKQKLAAGVNEDTANNQKNAMKRQFDSMLDRDAYDKLLGTGERRMSHKAMLSAVMISLYHRQPCFQQCYQMLNLFMDVDSLIASWRHKHVLLVQRQIGRKPGTGGTDGFSYLHKTVSEKYQIFIDLFNVSSYLIPQHFLPKVIEPVPEPATSISSLRLQESPQISIHNHDCPLQ